MLKKAAIEEGQWDNKEEENPAESLRVTIAILNAGRGPGCDGRRERDAAEAAKAGQPIPLNLEID